MIPAVAASGVQGEEGGAWTAETWGAIELQSRVYPAKPSYPQQKDNDFGLALTPTFHFENEVGHSFTLTPFVRYDASDSERTHTDLREAYFLTFGYLGDLEWEFRIGIDQIFWGIAESSNPVNIVNQTDLVEHPSGKEKLGQPMLHGTFSGELGGLDLFVLPFHRPRTFPGQSGRLRTAVPVLSDGNSIEYEHRSGKRHVDLAARYSHSVGPVDFGLSYFKGTSREPVLIPVPIESPLNLKQRYNQIRQFGLEFQFTQDAFIGKAEIINRQGIFDWQGTDRTSHNVFVVGGEYALHGVFGSDADLTLFAELNRDGRGLRATTALQNDLFLAARYALNDVNDTNFTVSLLDDLDYETRSLNLEFNRRLNDSVSLKVEALKFLDTDGNDGAAWQIRNDEFVSVNLKFSY